MVEQILTIAVVLTITGGKDCAKQQEIKAPNAPKACIIHSIVKALELTLTGIKAIQPLRQGLVVIRAIDIPTLHRLQVTIMVRDGIMVPIPSMGEDILVGEPRGHVIRGSHRDDVDQSLALGLEQGGQLLEGLG